MANAVRGSRALSFGLLALLVVSCATLAPSTVTPSTGTTPTTASRSTPTPLPPPVATDAARLMATVQAAIPPTVTVAPPASGTLGVAHVDVVPLSSTGDFSMLYAAFSEGLRRFNPPEQHFVAIYRPTGGGFIRLAQLELPSSDFLGSDAVSQFSLDPTRLWLQVVSGAGANSGCFDILSFDGTTLRDEAHQCLADPNLSRLQDVTGAGVPEVVLDQSDHLVYCHACGVSHFKFQVLRWNGTAFVELSLASVPSAILTPARDLANHAVSLARGGLWRDAALAIAQAAGDPVAARDPIFRQDSGLIQLYADAFGQQARRGPDPLLDNVLYGDYAAALDVMRPLTPDQIFRFDSPLISRTPARGF